MISETGSETPDLQAQGQTRRSVMTEDRFHAIDTLLVHLKTALSEQDWEEIAKLNQLVRPTIEPVMTALEAGELDPEPVRERLARLQAFCDRANNSANQAKAEAQKALEGVNQNRSAAKAYRNVSGNPQK
jgi:ribosome-binding ATPase YchF (GTP1/OBG family)